MRIAYIVFENFNQESGVIKKIRDQIKTWISSGHNVKFFVVQQPGTIWQGMADIPHEIILPEQKSNLEKQIFQWKPDIVYLRFALRYRRMKKIMKIIIEKGGECSFNDPFQIFILKRIPL